jgi:hypothetical protein
VFAKNGVTTFAALAALDADGITAMQGVRRSMAKPASWPQGCARRGRSEFQKLTWHRSKESHGRQAVRATGATPSRNDWA